LIALKLIFIINKKIKLISKLTPVLVINILDFKLVSIDLFEINLKFKILVTNTKLFYKFLLKIKISLDTSNYFSF